MADTIQDYDKGLQTPFCNCPYLAAQHSSRLFNEIEIVLRSVALHGENEYNLKAKNALIGKIEGVIRYGN